MSQGIIERIDEHNVAWGVLDDGQTFDIPSYGHKAGDRVVKNIRPEDAPEEDGDVSFILISERHATVIVGEHTDEGIEIISAVRINKPVN